MSLCLPLRFAAGALSVRGHPRQSHPSHTSVRRRGLVSTTGSAAARARHLARSATACGRGGALWVERPVLVLRTPLQSGGSFATAAPPRILQRQRIRGGVRDKADRTKGAFKGDEYIF